MRAIHGLLLALFSFIIPVALAVNMTANGWTFLSALQVQLKDKDLDLNPPWLGDVQSACGWEGVTCDPTTGSLLELVLYGLL
jgi:hypothetical protein